MKSAIKVVCIYGFISGCWIGTKLHIPRGIKEDLICAMLTALLPFLYFIIKTGCDIQKEIKHG